MARRLLVCQARGIFNLANRLYDVDSAGTFAQRDLCVPNSCIEIGGEIDIGCHPVPLTYVPRIAGLDQVSWLELDPCAMEEPFLLQVFGRAKNAFVHTAICQSVMSCAQRSSGWRRARVSARVPALFALSDRGRSRKAPYLAAPRHASAQLVPALRTAPPKGPEHVDL